MSTKGFCQKPLVEKFHFSLEGLNKPPEPSIDLPKDMANYNYNKCHRDSKGQYWLLLRAKNEKSGHEQGEHVSKMTEHSSFVCFGFLSIRIENLCTCIRESHLEAFSFLS